MMTRAKEWALAGVAAMLMAGPAVAQESAAAKVRTPNVTVTAGMGQPKRFGSPITLVILIGPHLQL